VGEEESLPVDLYSVRDADIARGPARAGRKDRLHHRVVRADALEHRVSTNFVGQVLDARNALVAAFGYNVGSRQTRWRASGESRDGSSR
jgi:hypothetical protein